VAGREEQSSNEPSSRYSADGKWWWDGEQWQSTEGKADRDEEPAPLYEPARDGRPLLACGVLAVGLTVAATVALIWVVASLAGVRLPFGGPAPSHSSAPRRSPTPHATATPSQSPSPQPSVRPSPSASPDQGGQAARYIQTVVNGAQHMNGQIDAVNHGCDGQASLSTCRAALAALQGKVHEFEHDLDGVTAPACLQSTDGELRQGLTLFDHGVASAIGGIDRSDPSQISSGMQTIQQAGDHLNQATAHAQSATC
jgi:hypothetical protein